MKPFDLERLSERHVELMIRLEGMASTCQMETQALNEEERASYSKILDEAHSINAVLDAAEQGQVLSQVERRAAATEEAHAQGELENRVFECCVRGITLELETREAVNTIVGDNDAVIPISIANKIIGIVREISPLYQRVAHYNMGGNLTIFNYDEPIQKITTAYATGSTTLTPTSGKFTSISLSGFPAGTLTKASISLVNNSKFDIVFYVIRGMTEAATEWIGNELINSTVSETEGLSKVTASVTVAAATAVVADGFIDLQESIPDAL